jgi:hypothetical protein
MWQIYVWYTAIFGIIKDIKNVQIIPKGHLIDTREQCEIRKHTKKDSGLEDLGVTVS